MFLLLLMDNLIVKIFRTNSCFYINKIFWADAFWFFRTFSFSRQTPTVWYLCSTKHQTRLAHSWQSIYSCNPPKIKLKGGEFWTSVSFTELHTELFAPLHKQSKLQIVLFTFLVFEPYSDHSPFLHDLRLLLCGQTEKWMPINNANIVLYLPAVWFSIYFLALPFQLVSWKFISFVFPVSSSCPQLPKNVFFKSTFWLLLKRLSNSH